jgi:hypothetical protein
LRLDWRLTQSTVVNLLSVTRTCQYRHGDGTCTSSTQRLVVGDLVGAVEVDLGGDRIGRRHHLGLLDHVDGRMSK